MIKQNMHIHSNYSWDSSMKIGEIAKILYENGIKYGAITDHIEFDREDLSDVLTKLKARNLKIDKINELYDGKLILSKAVEISQPHLYKEQVKRLEELELDFIMGSIHKIDKNAKTNSEKINAFRSYYKEVLKMVEDNQIDVVGHLDYIIRYYDKDYSDTYLLKQILSAIKENDQIIEINTSASRRCNMNVFPSLEKICFYKFKKDEIIIGTDAHDYSELTDNLEQAELISKEIGLKPVVYQKRKRIIL